MDESSVQAPLLPNSGFINPSYAKKKKPFLGSFLKWVLKISMWAIFLAWVTCIFLYPTELGTFLFENWVRATEGTVYGITGSFLLLFGGPILLISFLAILYLVLFGEEEIQYQENKVLKSPSFRLWTFPVLVDGPFGVVSAAELIGILIFAVYVIWAVTVYTIRNFKQLSEIPLSPRLANSSMLELSGLRFGMIGLILLAFLFLPIARGSVLLRLIDIPFEQATRYHVWLGHLTMFMFTLHGLFYVIAWTMQGRLIHEILEWKSIGIANLAGVISLTAGLFMWVTSLPPVRKRNFELFFYTHQLYVVFVVFLALHVGDFIFSIAATGIFLFMLDRFLRFCQSRRTVNVVSATSLPCGTLELVLSKHGSLRYNALSFIFLQVRELSLIQWHPFSVSSSPLDGKYHLSVLIKVLGGWTAKLRKQICSERGTQTNLPFLHHSKITVSAEGPYGHESPYHLMYENLILIAGGIGISPFLAVLRDIFHRINEGKPCLPKNILIVWAVKRSDELPLLSTGDIESIFRVHTNKMKLEIQIYVTREVEPPLEEGRNPKNMNPSVFPVSSGRGMSPLVGTGDNIWSGIYVVSSTFGLLVLVALLNIYYINPYKVSTWWYKGLLFIVCMVASVTIFGGVVIGLWNLWEESISTREESDDTSKQIDSVQQDELLEQNYSWQESFASSRTITYGGRPDFKEIFGSVSEHWGHVDIGVLVCGPPTLQSSVAKECRSQNLNRSCCSPIFHFNSHSFDL